MAVAITVPRLGWSMEHGTFVEWLKRDGDLIRPGDALFVLESEKAAENIEALAGRMILTGSDADMRRRLGANGKARARRLFSAVQSARQFRQLVTTAGLDHA